MIWCPRCKRLVKYRQEGVRIFCAECGEEITASYDVTYQHPDSQSPEPMKTGTYEEQHIRDK